MSKLKSLVKDWLPPAILRVIHQLRGGGIHFEGNYATWEKAAAICTGYDADSILAKVLEATLTVKRGEAAYERDTVLFEKIEYSWPVTTALMWVAAQCKGRLNVLDFGGALGSGYFQNNVFLNGLHEARWSVIEQEHYVRAGREYIENESLKFFFSIEEYSKSNEPNVILVASVLEYLPNYRSILEDLARLNANVIIIDRSVFSLDGIEAIKIQKVVDSCFKATLPCRLMSINTIIKLLEKNGYKEFYRYPSIGGRGKDYEFIGMVFKKETQ